MNMACLYSGKICLWHEGGYTVYQLKTKHTCVLWENGKQYMSKYRLSYIIKVKLLLYVHNGGKKQMHNNKKQNANVNH